MEGKQPYVKKYEDGLLVNPISGSYTAPGLNRKARRESIQKQRFINNSKGFHLAVGPSYRYKKVVQVIDGKRICHDIMVTSPKARG